MSEIIDVAGTEDEGPAELERVFPQFVLTMSCGLGSLSR